MMNKLEDLCGGWAHRGGIAFSNGWKVETILEHDPCPPLTHIKVFSLTSVFCRHTHLVLSQSRSYLDYFKVLALVWSSSRALLSWERWNTGMEAVQQIQTLRGRIHNTLVYIGPVPASLSHPIPCQGEEEVLTHIATHEILLWILICFQTSSSS